MRRREFITLLGGVAAAWPLETQAQQPAMPVIGWLETAGAGVNPHLEAAFRQGLNDVGFVDGQNLIIEARWGDGRYDRLPELASDLVSRHVSLIAATGSVPAALAAKAATTSIPVVFLSGGDPIKYGLVSSLGRPGGNLTGATVFSVALTGKRLGLLHELVPKAKIVAVMMNGKNPDADAQEREVQDAARALGIQLHVLSASNESEIDAAFATLAREQLGALFVTNDSFLTSSRNRLVALAKQARIPAIYAWREFAAAGGLMSYGTSLIDSYRQVGIYAGRILRGAKPAELPVLIPSKFELVINLKAAKAVGLEIPNTMQLLADEVID